MTFLAPYAVDGLSTPASQARGALFDSTNGESGVLGAGALRVVALAGGSVGIGPGSGVIGVESRRESYRVSNTAMDGDAVIAVPTAGTAGETWYVGVRVIDAQYEGQTSSLVPRISTSVAGLGAVALRLAKFTLPAGGTVGSTTPITDQRAVAIPRKDIDLPQEEYVGTPIAITSSTYQTVQTLPTYIPAWATQAKIQITVSGLLVARSGALVIGSMTPSFVQDASALRTTRIEGETKARATYVASGTWPIAASFRGTDRVVDARLRRTSGTGDLYVDATTSFSAVIAYRELAD